VGFQPAPSPPFFTRRSGGYLVASLFLRRFCSPLGTPGLYRVSVTLFPVLRNHMFTSDPIHSYGPTFVWTSPRGPGLWLPTVFFFFPPFSPRDKAGLSFCPVRPSCSSYSSLFFPFFPFPSTYLHFDAQALGMHWFLGPRFRFFFPRAVLSSGTVRRFVMSATVVPFFFFG